jgi:hypothetical protein
MDRAGGRRATIGPATLLFLVLLVTAVVVESRGAAPATPGTGPQAAEAAAAPTAAGAAPAEAIGPAIAPGKARRWSIAPGQEPGADVLDAATFSALDTGSCLVWLSSSAVSAVACDRPHSAEVSGVHDITADFATTPTQDGITALSGRYCPDDRRAWIGSGLTVYADAYLWRWEPGAAGPALRRMLCTVSLADYAPFTGTLRNSA